MGCWDALGIREAHHGSAVLGSSLYYDVLWFYDVLGPAENYVGFCRCGRCIRFSWSKFRWETWFETIATSLLRCSKYTLSKTILPITEERERDPRLKQDKTRQRKHHQSPRSVVTSCKGHGVQEGCHWVTQIFRNTCGCQRRFLVVRVCKEPFFFEESLTFLQDTRYIHIHTRPVASTFKGACFSTDVHHDKNTIRLFGWHNITGIWLWGCVGLGSCLVYWSRIQRHSNSRWSIHIKPNYTMRMNIRT